MVKLKKKMSLKMSQSIKLFVDTSWRKCQQNISVGRFIKIFGRIDTPANSVFINNIHKYFAKIIDV